jgi:RNA polymerase sigma-70 factor (ECF subfamily)
MQSAERVRRERALRRAVRAGDERAWRTWYDESFAGLHRYVLWRCGGRRDHADEVVQETWLTAVRRVGLFDPAAGPFAAWLRGVAANLLRNHFRREVRRARCTVPLDADLPAPGDEADRDRGERVARALAALPERFEAALRAKYLEGRSVVEIAAETGDSPKAVESLLTRARQAFREAYTAEED